MAPRASRYEVPRCAPGTPTEACVHEIRAAFTVGDFNRHDGISPAQWGASSSVTLITVHGHCHAPTCLSMELFNADTGALICRQAPAYGGTGVAELVGTPFDEPGYIATPPCLWGSREHGLETPPLMNGVTIRAVALTNTSYGHHGEMALPEVTLGPAP